MAKNQHVAAEPARGRHRGRARSTPSSSPSPTTRAGSSASAPTASSTSTSSLDEGTENCDYLHRLRPRRHADPRVPLGQLRAGLRRHARRRRRVDDPLPAVASRRRRVVLVDLVDVDDGAPVEVSPRRILQAPGRAAARRRLRADDRQRARVLPVQGGLRRRQRRRLPRPHAELAVPRGLQHPPDHEGGGRARRASAAGCAAPGSRSSSPRARPARGQHEVNLTYQTGASRWPTSTCVFKTAVKEIAHARGQVGDVHGQAALRRRRLELPHPLQPVDRRRHAQRDARRRRAPHERRVPLVPRRADGDGARVRAAVRAERQQLQAVPARQLGADRRSAGTSTTARSASASSATARACASRAAIPGADANAYHAFAATIAGGLHGIEQRIEPPPPYHGNGYTADDLPRIPSTFVEAIELWRGSELARECFGDDVHHHVLQPRRVRVAGVQPHRHRLGARPLLRADLT